MDYWRGKHISVCKACGKVGGGPGACSPGEILILDLLLAAIGGIWDCFMQT